MSNKQRVQKQSKSEQGSNAKSTSFFDVLLQDDTVRSTRLSMMILVVATVLSLVPFVNKAFHLDDPLFIWSSQQIQKHPGDPFGFDINWYQSSKPMWYVTKNPPGACYYIAGAASVLGYNEFGLHLAFMLPALGAVLGTFLLARYFCRNSLLASLMTLFTPVFMVSAGTVMCDVLMLCLWVFAIYFWLKGLSTGGHHWFFIASLLIPLCALTKYFGMTLIPMLLIVSAWKTRRPGLWIIHFIIPVAVLWWYQNWTQGMYTVGLLSDAAGYANRATSNNDVYSISRTLVGASFTGGCVAAVLFFCRRFAGWLEISIGAVLAIIISISVGASDKLGGFALPAVSGVRSVMTLQFGLWAVVGFALLALSIRDFWKRRDAESALLLMWILGTFAFATFINWSVNGRSVLPMIPAAAFILVRRIEERRTQNAKSSVYATVVPLGLSFVMSFMALYGDTQLANTARKAAEEIHTKYTGRNLWFQGHWGFQYYFEGQGGHAIDVREFRPKVGDIVVQPINNSNVYNLPENFAKRIEVIDYKVPTIVATMNRRAGAGFYADIFGILPFSFGAPGPESYYIYQIL